MGVCLTFCILLRCSTVKREENATREVILAYRSPLIFAPGEYPPLHYWVFMLENGQSDEVRLASHEFWPGAI
jgi:hypothetical protein